MLFKHNRYGCSKFYPVWVFSIHIIPLNLNWELFVDLLMIVYYTVVAKSSAHIYGGSPAGPAQMENVC